MARAQPEITIIDFVGKILMAIRHAGAGDSQLLDIKHDLYDQMMQRKKDLKKGLEQGVESKSYEFVNNLLKQTDFDDSRISVLAGVSIDFVRKVRESSGRK